MPSIPKVANNTDLLRLFVVVWIQISDHFDMERQSLLFHEVTLRSARGNINRTVIAELNDVLVVAGPDNVEEAKIAGITRFSIGFRRSDVLAVDGVDISAWLKHNVQYEQAEHGEAGTDRRDAD